MGDSLSYRDNLLLYIIIFHIHKLSTKKLKENKKVRHKIVRKYDKHSMESLNSNLQCTDWRKFENNEGPNIY